MIIVEGNTQAIEDFTLNATMMAMTEYTGFTGKPPKEAPENFVRDYCSLAIQNQLGLTTLTEMDRVTLEYLFFRNDPKSFDGNRELGRFKPDLLVLDRDDGRMIETRVRLLVEFKRDANPDKIQKDVNRTAAVLSAIKSANPHCQQAIGYQVVCSADRGTNWREWGEEYLKGLNGTRPEMFRCLEHQTDKYSIGVIGLHVGVTSLL